MKREEKPIRVGALGLLDHMANWWFGPRRSPQIARRWTPKTSVPIYDFVYDFACFRPKNHPEPPHSQRVAEGAGFEPAEPFGSPVFKTGAINHSTIPPQYRTEDPDRESGHACANRSTDSTVLKSGRYPQALSYAGQGFQQLCGRILAL